MNQTPIPVVDLRDFTQGTPVEIARFIGHFGRALERVGFVAISHPGLDLALVQEVYALAETFFALPQELKQQYTLPHIQGQRGFTGFGQEHAKNQSLPDLKEFWHMGPDLAEGHPMAATYPANIWPKEIPQWQPLMTRLYHQLEGCSQFLLEACALYIGEPRHLLRNMVEDGNTVLRVLHYPSSQDCGPEGEAWAAAGAVRSAAHEDINLITLLDGATAPGLEVKDHDGKWQKVELAPGQLLCNGGDMLQWFTNGLFRSTTHRVTNEGWERSARLSMPYFVHPRPRVDLAPLSSCVAKTGGQVRFPPITAQTYLTQRLKEIGLA